MNMRSCMNLHAAPLRSWFSSLIVTIASDSSENQYETDNTNKEELSNRAQNKKEKETFKTKESENYLESLTKFSMYKPNVLIAQNKARKKNQFDA